MNDTSKSDQTGSDASCPLCETVVDNVLANEMRRGEGLVNYCSACEHGFLSNHNIFNEKARFTEQDHNNSTYAKKIQKS